MLRDRSTAIIIALFVLALAVRLAWSAWTQPVPPRQSDPEYYHATALSLAHGDGYSVTAADRGFLPGGEATAFWPPGYSAFLAPAFAVVGDRLWTAWVMNAIAGALTIVPLYFIGRRLFGETAGVLSAAIAALLPSFVFWTPVLFSDTLFTFLFACAIAAVLHAFDRNRARAPLIISAGLLIGFATLVRGQALVLVPIAAAWWLIESGQARHAMRPTAATTIVALLVIAPWAVRNQIVMDSPILVSANVGYNLRGGHAPYSTGRYVFPRDLWDAEPGSSFHDREAVFNNLGTRRALRYAATHPEREVSLTGRKIMWLWRPDSDVLEWTSTFGATPRPQGAHQPLLILIDATYGAVLLPAGASLLWFRHHGRQITFALLVVASWTALHVVFFGEPRYHLPMLVVLIPMAASTIVWALDETRSLTQRSPRDA